jgi:UPF0716 family protein affecting phage T7 exclusion
MASGNQLRLNLGEALVGLGIVCQALEIVRSVRPTNAALAENMAGVMICIACFMLFLAVPGFGTSTFALILLLLLADDMTDPAVMVFTARRSVGGF